MFVVIGSVTADLLVMSDASLTNPGEDGFRSSNLVFTEAPLTLSIGGNGGNSAYVLAGLGAPTALCGAVGQDMLGDSLVHWLSARGVDLRGLALSPHWATSSSTIIMRDAANQVVFHHLGSTAQARFDEMPPELFQQARALLISSFPIMSSLRPDGFARALRAVHAAGGLTAVDIGPAIGAAVTLEEIAPLLPDMDFLIANTHELCALVSVDDWQAAAQRVLAAGASHVVIKQGAAGASVWTSEDRLHVPAFPVAANVSVGAGDSFNAGLLYGLQAGWPLRQALRFANAVAALVVGSARGVLDSPSLAEVESFLNSQP